MQGIAVEIAADELHRGHAAKGGVALFGMFSGERGGVRGIGELPARTQHAATGVARYGQHLVGAIAIHVAGGDVDEGEIAEIANRVRARIRRVAHVVAVFRCQAPGIGGCIDQHGRLVVGCSAIPHRWPSCSPCTCRDRCTGDWHRCLAGCRYCRQRSTRRRRRRRLWHCGN